MKMSKGDLWILKGIALMGFILTLAVIMSTPKSTPTMATDQAVPVQTAPVEQSAPAATVKTNTNAKVVTFTIKPVLKLDSAGSNMQDHKG